jgi:hypothetical protein
MKTLKSLIFSTIFALCACVTTARADSNFVVNLWDAGKTFLTDNTNIFNQGSVQFELGPIVNVDNGEFGFDFDAQFPIAQQASVGFDVLYYGGHAYNGTFNTTLGTTWIVPRINQPVYTYVQVGVGTDLQDMNSIINVEWVGAKTQWKIKSNLFVQGDVLKVGVNLAAGHMSNVTGTLAKAMGILEYDY